MTVHSFLIVVVVFTTHCCFAEFARILLRSNHFYPVLGGNNTYKLKSFKDICKCTHLYIPKSKDMCELGKRRGGIGKHMGKNLRK